MFPRNFTDCTKYFDCLMVWYGPYSIEGSSGFLTGYKTTWFDKVELGCGNLDNTNMGFLYSY